MPSDKEKVLAYIRKRGIATIPQIMDEFGLELSQVGTIFMELANEKEISVNWCDGEREGGYNCKCRTASGEWVFTYTEVQGIKQKTHQEVLDLIHKYNYHRKEKCEHTACEALLDDLVMFVEKELKKETE